jgi:hypothetical protein
MRVEAFFIFFKTFTQKVLQGNFKGIIFFSENSERLADSWKSYPCEPADRFWKALKQHCLTLLEKLLSRPAF